MNGSAKKRNISLKWTVAWDNPTDEMGRATGCDLGLIQPIPDGFEQVTAFGLRFILWSGYGLRGGGCQDSH